MENFRESGVDEQAAEHDQCKMFHCFTSEPAWVQTQDSGCQTLAKIAQVTRSTSVKASMVLIFGSRLVGIPR